MLIQHTDELRHVGVRDLHVHGLHDHLPHQNRHIRGARREHLRKKHVNNLPPGPHEGLFSSTSDTVSYGL